MSFILLSFVVYNLRQLSDLSNIPMPKYHKLVRDFIPEIIEKAGKKCSVTILSDEDYRNFLEKKLDEELSEYKQSHDLEEMADLLEVIYALIKVQGFTPEDLEALRLQKAQKRGVFEKKLLLKEVFED